MQTNIDITQAILNTPEGFLSIHQLSQNLQLPYGTTYNRIHLLNSQNVIQILPQGKAKLCALNPDNPMTKCLLALGGAQATEKYKASLGDNKGLFDKIIKTIQQLNKGNIISAILLSPIPLTELTRQESDNLSQNPTENQEPLESLQGTIDFFIIKSNDSFDESEMETKLSCIFPQNSGIAVTIMAVDKDALKDMLTTEEEEAGLAAYNMLREGIILDGYESFFDIILEVFANKISSLSLKQQ